MEIVITEEAREMLNDPKNNYIVYGHHCIKTDKWYIGISSHAINDLEEKRFGRDGWMYKRKKDHSSDYKHPKFANAIFAYGWNSFEHIILGAYRFNEISDAEKNWILKKDSFTNGYNSTTGGVGKYNADPKKKSSPVDMIDSKTKEIIKTFKSAKEAAIEIGAYNNASIIACCRGQLNIFKSYIWRYHDGISNRGNIHEPLAKKVVKGYRTDTKVHQLSLNGEFIKEYSSVKKTAEALGINQSLIARCCRGERKSTHGFKFTYPDINGEVVDDI